MTRYRGILFDKDGTLFSFAETWGPWARRFLAELGAGDTVLTAELGTRVGYDPRSGFRRDSVMIAGTPEEIADALLPALDGMTRESLLTRMAAQAGGTALAEVTDLGALLGDLAAQGLRLGVATNDAESVAHENFVRLGVTGMFDFVAGFDSGYGSKPAPGMLLAFAAQFGLKPADCVMVGDSTRDLLAGRAAGMATVGVLTGIAGREELAPYSTAVLPGIGHLPEWLKTPGGQGNAASVAGSSSG